MARRNRREAQLEAKPEGGLEITAEAAASPGPATAIAQYRHTNKQRVNNQPVGLVTPDTDKDAGRKVYAYDPHLDPQVVWAGKTEHTSFEVPTVSLHVHERIDPRTIIKAVQRRGYWS